MLTKNQTITLTITAMSAEGSGIGRYPEEAGGMAVFVPFTAVGDTLRCRIVKVQKQLAYGICEELLVPSPHRTDCATPCSAFGKCGGCVYRHVNYEAELQYKWQRVADALQRIGGLLIEPRPIVGCDTPDRYRNKAQYPVEAVENGVKIGFYAARSHRLVEQTDCLLQPVVFSTVLEVVKEWVQKANVPLYDETTHTGLLRHIYIRQGEKTGELMVCLVATSGKIPQSDDLVSALRDAVPHLTSVMVNINRKDTNVVLGDTGFALYGKPYIQDVLCGLTFRLSPLSFYQVNHTQAQRLYTLAAEKAALTGNEVLLDMYCGTGTIGLTMARSAKELIGVEVVPQAVEDARLNAENNDIHNARFIAADAAKAAKLLETEGIKPDVVVLDPPRKGCDEELIHTVCRMAPSRVVYVSCDPATLARDIRRFSENGYTAEEVTPVDMFPRTAHIETVALLIKEHHLTKG
ncbi:MAG: 23S rRNA (uracil(1939)-C(5))-methyltransferase RlmD, partial [Clostridia bacterium]|nr:23S rRNA (uracil(1939)-C(5))-methyltransferase RlmD [Clostridia bacterium]